MDVIFLDIDGVLNRIQVGEPMFHPECIANLTEILRETGCSTVLSSSWREIIHRGDMTMSGFKTMLNTHGLYGLNLVGITDPDDWRDDEWTRGRQIRLWLAENRQALGIRNYCVLDDDDDGISELHPLIRTDWRTGLTAAQAREAIDILLQGK